MAQWTTEEYAEIEKLGEHAIDHTYWTVSCDFCYKKTDELEYPEGDDAYEMGFRIVEVKNGKNIEEYVACKECQEKEAWKEWEDDTDES